MMTKYFKSFILFFLICLSFHLFTETIVYAEQQTNEISQKTNESTLHNSTNEDSSKNTNKDISTSVSSNESEKDSKKDTDNNNNNNNNATAVPNKQEEVSIPYGWKTIDSKKYYIVSDKVLEKTGWFMEKDVNPDITSKDKGYDDKYYLDSDFSVVIGWKEIDGTWYYFNKDGILQTGWVYDNNIYYTDKNGAMETGWQKINGDTYYFDQYGHMATHKTLIDDNWYFFSDDGQLQKGLYYYKNKEYYSDDKGIMVVNTWVDSRNHKYYIKSDGSVATGKLYLNGTMEDFNSNGYYQGSDKNDKDYLFVRHLNVGNADCAFIRLPSGETVLIDTGDTTTSSTLIDFLNSQNLKKDFFQSTTSSSVQAVESNTSKTSNGKGVVDYVVLTHPHSDHIGGVIDLLKNFNVGKILVPKYFEMKDFASMNDTTSSASEKEIMKHDYEVYTATMNAIKKSGVPLVTAEPKSYIDSENILQFVHADKDYPSFEASNPYQEYTLLNNNSALVYLNYHDLQELFAADIEWGAENDFVSRKALDGKEVDVLKIPHHGNPTSSSYPFIGYVNPIIGIISRAQESISTTNESYNVLTTCGVNIFETSSDPAGISVYSTKDNWNVEPANSKY